MVTDDLSSEQLGALWSRHNAEWRDAAQVASQWEEAAALDRRLLFGEVYGEWWDILQQLQITLLVTREYEHLLMGLTAPAGIPQISYMKLPHPSGLTVDEERGVVYVASTRNPNQIYDFVSVAGLMPRLDVDQMPLDGRPLLPVRSRFLPGCSYLHDLAIIDGQLHANSVGQNAVIHVAEQGRSSRVWWPACIEVDGKPIFEQNHIQLNSIAAGATLEESFFSASADEVTLLRPGHPDYPVDRRGVIFSGATREPIVRGLTRPHSVRRFAGRLWVDNSGYGEFGFAEGDKFVSVAHLPGWTRGLCFRGGIAFVGTSRVIPRFRKYAPGLDPDVSQCGIHAVDLQSGQCLGGITWDYGNQIFAVECVDASFASGFAFDATSAGPGEREKILFYSYYSDNTGESQDD